VTIAQQQGTNWNFANEEGGEPTATVFHHHTLNEDQFGDLINAIKGPPPNPYLERVNRIRELHGMASGDGVPPEDVAGAIAEGHAITGQQRAIKTAPQAPKQFGRIDKPKVWVPGA
jgi:hypothetical protein